MTKEEIKRPRIGRRGLESPGCDKGTMFLAARDKFGYNIDVIHRLVEDGNEKQTGYTISALYRNARFRQSDLIGKDGLEKEEVHVYLGEDLLKMLQKNLQNRINEARANGLSKEGTNTLNSITDRNKPIF